MVTNDFIQFDVDDPIVNKTLNLFLDYYTDILTKKMVTLLRSRRNILVRRMVYGSAKYNTKFLGMIDSELFKRAMDKRTQGMIGFTPRYNVRKKLTQALLKSTRVESSRFNPKNVFTKFFIRHTIMRSLLPHPATRRKDGQNIKVKSWLDWLHGEEGVPNRKFVSLAKLTYLNSKKGKKKSSKKNKKKTGTEKLKVKNRKRKKTKLPRSYPLAGRDSGYMIFSSSEWKMPNPLSYSWTTERNLYIGSDMLDYFEMLVYKANSQAQKEITPSTFSASF